MKTEDLLVALARDAKPLQRLRHPWHRGAMWAAATCVYLAGIALFLAPAERIGDAFVDVRFAIEQVVAIVVGVTAAAAALATTVPGYGSRVLIAPIAAGILWIGIVAIGGLPDLLRYEASEILFRTDWPCVMAIVVTGALPAVGLFRMVRRGAPVTPRVTMALVALSAAILANVIACLVRAHDSSVTVLLWHGTLALAITTAAAFLGTSMLKWRVSPPARAH